MITKALSFLSVYSVDRKYNGINTRGKGKTCIRSIQSGHFYTWKQTAVVETFHLRGGLYHFVKYPADW
jgi:hypothetical protein